MLHKRVRVERVEIERWECGEHCGRECVERQAGFCRVL
jgi:hypothetical protein